MIPTERYQGAVLPPLMALMASLGLIEPIGFTRSGRPIWPIEGGDGSQPINLRERIAARNEADETAARALITTAEAEDRDLSDEEMTQVRDFRAAIDRRDSQIADLEALEQRAQRSAQAQSQSRPGVPLAAVSTVTVTRNEAVYRPGGESDFLRDLFAVRNGDFEAGDRLRRNNAEGMERERREWNEARRRRTDADRESGEIAEVRDGTTGATSMGSFIPPVWLVSELAERARVGRVLAPFIRDGGFPTTNSITIPRITTGSSQAGQAGDNAAVSETDIVTAQLTRTTVTIAGQQDVSVQSLDLSPFNVSEIIFADLEGAYQAELDRQILRGSGTNELLGINQISGINTVTYTDASPTAAELYPKFGDAMQQIHAARFAPAQLVSMHPRRWAWISTSVDSTGRPLGIPAGVGAFNPAAVFGDVAAQGVVGTLSNGLAVVATGSHATNLGGGTEDQIVVFRPVDMILMESPLRTRLLSEVLSNTLTVRLQLFAYVNFFAGRFPASISTIGGTGLAAPTF